MLSVRDLVKGKPDGKEYVVGRIEAADVDELT